MSDVRVCCISLTADRQQFTDRAVKCFLSQTYTGSMDMLIFDTGAEPYEWEKPLTYFEPGIRHLLPVVATGFRGQSIGALRNAALGLVMRSADIIVHWDSDDWSAPTRIAEQVEMLIQSKADAVGYNEMLMWKRTPMNIYEEDFLSGARTLHQYEDGEAWLYTHGSRNYLIGTSLCYWRRTWQAKPFPDRNTGEDTEWQKGLKTAGCSSLAYQDLLASPRLIAEIHGANTCLTIEPRSEQWKRVPEWDARLRETMKL